MGGNGNFNDNSYEVTVTIKHDGKRTFRGNIKSGAKGAQDFLEAVIEARLIEPIVTGRGLYSSV